MIHHSALAISHPWRQFISTELSPEAADYREQVQSLGDASQLDPVVELEYGPDPAQRLDVYAPPNAAELPVLVFFHGGAWINGSRAWLRFMAPIVTALPAIFVAGTYRLGPTHRWPAQYEDLRDAVACAAAGVPKFGGDPNRMVVGGHSAGGHLAAMAVLRREIPAVRACFPVSSPYNIQYGNVPEDSPENRVYKYLLNDRAEDFDASPIEFVAGNRTPFHIIWGERDFDRICRQGPPMVEALSAEGAVVTHEVLPGASHFDTHLSLADPSCHWYQRVREELLC